MPEYRILVQEIHRDAPGNVLRTPTKFEHDVDATNPLEAISKVFYVYIGSDLTCPFGPVRAKPVKTPALKVVKAKRVKGHGANPPKSGLGQW